MRRIAYSLIEDLSFNYTNPDRASRLMRNFLSQAMLVTKATLTKNVLLNYRDCKVGFKEVEEIAERLLNQQKYVDKSSKKKYDIIKVEYEKMCRKALKTSKDQA